MSKPRKVHVAPRLTQLLGQLRRELAKASLTAFEALCKARPREHFYAFILYTEPLLGYVIPSSNSEEQLARQSCDVRWSPCDWAYHGRGRRRFSAVQAILRRLDVGSSDDDSLWDRVFAAFVGALADLDAGGHFGRRSERDRILVNVMWGDADVVLHLETARRLNPRSAFRMYATSEIPTLRAAIREMQRSPNAGRSLAKARRLLAMIEARPSTSRPRSSEARKRASSPGAARAPTRRRQARELAR